MNIQSKIKLIVSIWIVFATIVAGMVFYLNREIAAENRKLHVSTELNNDIFQLSVLTNDYIINREDRARLQWLKKYEDVRAYTEDTRLQLLANQQGIASNLERNIDTINNVFLQLVRNFEGGSIDQVDQDFQLRLIGQLSRVSQEIVSDTFFLSETSLENINKLKDRISFIMAILLFFIFAIAIFGGYVMLRGVAKPVRALAESKAKADSILRSISDALIVVDREGVITRANKSTIELLAVDPTKIIGSSVEKAISLVHHEKGKTKKLSPKNLPVSFALKHKKEKIITMKDNVHIKMKKDVLVPVAMTVAPILVHDELIGAVMVMRDVTEEKNVDQAKTEFVSLASHQLQTPLTSANWALEILMDKKEGKLTKKQRELVTDVFDSNERMKSLVRGLLNVSRIELGTFMVEPEPTDFSEVLESLIKELSSKIEEKKLQIKKTVKDIPKVPADPNLIRIVIQNILSNAIKYTPNKGIVTIALTKEKKGAKIDTKQAEADSVVLVIKDTGIGIPKSERDKIFSKMYRASNARSGETEGTGLGMYLAKSIVELANGDIWFSSEEGKGTTFYVVMPLAGMKKREGSKTLASIA